MLEDYWGRAVRLTDERRVHIVSHPEMRTLWERVPAVLHAPQLVCPSTTGDRVPLYCHGYADRERSDA